MILKAHPVIKYTEENSTWTPKTKSCVSVYLNLKDNAVARVVGKNKSKNIYVLGKAKEMSLEWPKKRQGIIAISVGSWYQLYEELFQLTCKWKQKKMSFY